MKKWVTICMMNYCGRIYFVNLGAEVHLVNKQIGLTMSVWTCELGENRPKLSHEHVTMQCLTWLGSLVSSGSFWPGFFSEYNVMCYFSTLLHSLYPDCGRSPFLSSLDPTSTPASLFFSPPFVCVCVCVSELDELNSLVYWIHDFQFSSI